MTTTDSHLRTLARRHLFGQCALGVGSIALASMLNQSARGAAASAPGVRPNSSPAAGDPLAPRKPHYAPKAKNFIYLFMGGGPSQLELFDYKPKLVELN